MMVKVICRVSPLFSVGGEVMRETNGIVPAEMAVNNAAFCGVFVAVAVKVKLMV